MERRTQNAESELRKETREAPPQFSILTLRSAFCVQSQQHRLRHGAPAPIRCDLHRHVRVTNERTLRGVGQALSLPGQTTSSPGQAESLSYTIGILAIDLATRRRRLGAGRDHPVSLFAPEGEYLKGFLIEVR